MNKLLSIIGAVTVVAAAAVAVLNFFYDIKFSLSINKKKDLWLDDDFDCCCDDDEACGCEAAAPEAPKAEEAKEEEKPADPAE